MSVTGANAGARERPESEPLKGDDVCVATRATGELGVRGTRAGFSRGVAGVGGSMKSNSGRRGELLFSAAGASGPIRTGRVISWLVPTMIAALAVKPPKAKPSAATNEWVNRVIIVLFARVFAAAKTRDSCECAQQQNR